MAVMERDRTEERINELSVRVERGFEEVDRRFGEVDRRLDRIDNRLEKIDERFEGVSAEFVAVRKEMKDGFDKLNRTMIWFAGILIVALFAQGFALLIQG